MAACMTNWQAADAGGAFQPADRRDGLRVHGNNDLVVRAPVVVARRSERGGEYRAVTTQVKTTLPLNTTTPMKLTIVIRCCSG